MKPGQIIGFFSFGILSFLFGIGCQTTDDFQLNHSDAGSSTQALTVSAAASLQDVMKAIQPLYESAYPDREIVYNFAASGSLQRQIEQGAPVDVFISAAIDKMDTLENKDLILTKTRRNLLKNQIVLVTQDRNQANLNLTDFNDLTRETINLIALGEPESLPAGKYTQQVRLMLLKA